MEKNKIQVCELSSIENGFEIERIGENEIVIDLPFKDFTFKITAPLFNIEGVSPARIRLIAISSNEFEIRVVTLQYKLITVVPSLVLEVFDPNGVRIIKIIAPPEE